MEELTVNKEELKNLIDSERSKLYRLCKHYLSGKWGNVSEDKIKVNIFDKGNACKIFHCQLPDECDYENTDNHSVVVKFMANVSFMFFKPLNTKITTTLMSLKGISPKVLGVFHEGIIFEFIEGRFYNHMDDYNDTTVALLATKLAQIHSTNVPIEKNGNYFNILYNIIFPPNNEDNLGVKQMLESCKSGEMRNLFDANNLKTLLNTDIAEEFRWTQRVFEKIKCPLVFSHNDFNRSNILIRGSGTHVNSINDILIIDFDNSCYNYRGLDIGRYFSCWKIESDFGCGQYPTDYEMRVFIDAYISEMIKLNGKCFNELEINSREHIIKESKFFTLFAYLVDSLFCVLMVNSKRTPIHTFSEWSEARLNGYVQLKRKFISENSVQI